MSYDGGRMLKRRVDGKKPEWYQIWQYVVDEGCELVGIDTAAAVFAGNAVRTALVAQTDSD